MGSITKSKTLFFTTSPRTPNKIIDEIRMLVDNFSGEEWNKSTQKKYATFLSKSELFKGKIKENDDFGARDRINRAPKSLGFVDLKPISVTEAGKKLLAGKRPYEVFTRQFLKLQFPSPYHTDKSGRYNVKPFLEFLRIISDLDGVTKTELAMFGMQLIHYKLYDDVVKQIISFREEKSSHKYTKKKEFIADNFSNVIKKVYADEINSDSMNLRESSSPDLIKFVNTKRRNMLDYADAAIRYLRSTELVSYDVKSLKIFVSKEKVKDVEFILSNTEREARSFDSEEEFKKYLFADNNIELFSDNKDRLKESISKLTKELIKNKVIEHEQDTTSFNIEKLKDTREKLSEKLVASIINNQKTELKTYSDYEDILDTYQKIMDRDVVDPSLILEWNTWRAMSMLNDGEINGMFKIDTDGSPLFTAPANTPDISCEYSKFRMTVEVTLSGGQKQYDMEGEPVARHLGSFKKEKEMEAFCLFIAPKISEGTLAHFFALHKIDIAYYGGRTKIIPFSLESFINILKVAKENKGITSSNLYNYINYLSNKALEIDNEKDWYELIETSSENWIKIS